MAAGNSNKISPIVRAIAQAQKRTTGEIRVHISKSWFERDAFANAQRVFTLYGMGKTRYRNAVLLYINLHTRKFAILGDEAVHREVGQTYWEELAKGLREDLLSTHFENAIAIAVRIIGLTLERYFPSEAQLGSSGEELSP